MKKIVAWAFLSLFAGMAHLDALANSFSSVQDMATPGKWPGGKIVWYYNPTGQPANVGTEEMINAVKTAFLGWQSVCQIESAYAGITGVPVAPSPVSTFVVGWEDFGSTQFNARGGHRSSATSSGYAPFTGGVIKFNSIRTDLRSSLDQGTLVGVIQHEIGHALGLAHSDDPTSIMFANPYNNMEYQRTIQGDDIAACADLYGGKGVISHPDLRSATPVGGFSVQASILAALPTSALPTATLTQIDPLGGGTYYFARYWRQLPIGSNLQARWVAPNGSVYRQAYFTTTTANGYRYHTFSDPLAFPFSGRWAFQVLVDGQLAANTPFDVVRAGVPAVLPFEAAMIGERNAAGNLGWRVVAYGSGQARTVKVIANGREATGASFLPLQGTNETEIWINTDRPRYNTGRSDGQPEISFDAMRKIQFSVSSDGALQASTVRVTESGTMDAYSAVATVSIGDAGVQGVYVVAVVGGRLLFRRSSGWSEVSGPLISVNGPAVTVLDVLRNFDTRNFPPGTALYVGHGTSLDDVLARRQYILIRQF